MEGDPAFDFVNVSREYFVVSGDQESFIWLFCHDELPGFVQAPACASLLRSSVHFGDERFSIHVIKQFPAARPFLLSLETFAHGARMRIPFRPTIIMDTQVVNYVHQYVTFDSKLSAHRRKAVRDFLHFAVSKQIDYNPIFYYLEGATKSQHGTFSPYAQARSESILTLHTMDKERFLESGDIAVDPARLAVYASRYGAATVKEMAPLYAQSVMRSNPEAARTAKFIYATLLKMGLIHRSSRRSVPAKYRELLLFMQQTLGISMGPERALALGFFSDQYDEYDRFIPIQRSGNPGELFRKLRKTAWDMLLLRLPGDLLARRTEDGVTVGYVCTSDRALRRIAAACMFPAVIALAPSIRPPLPIMSSDLSILESIVGKRAMTEIGALDAEWMGSTMSLEAGPTRRIPDDELATIVADLEAEAVRFCSS